MHDGWPAAGGEGEQSAGSLRTQAHKTCHTGKSCCLCAPCDWLGWAAVPPRANQLPFDCCTVGCTLLVSKHSHHHDHNINKSGLHFKFAIHTNHIQAVLRAASFNDRFQRISLARQRASTRLQQCDVISETFFFRWKPRLNPIASRRRCCDRRWPLRLVRRTAASTERCALCPRPPRSSRLRW